MKIIHLTGAQCSGKTHVVKQFLGNPNVSYWDILKFYETSGALSGNQMNWKIWDKIKDRVVPALNSWLIDNKDKHLCILESSSNARITTRIQELVAEGQSVTSIQLKTPGKSTLIARAKIRNISISQVLSFADVFDKRHSHPDVFQYTQAAASAIITAELKTKELKCLVGFLRSHAKQPFEL